MGEWVQSKLGNLITLDEHLKNIYKMKELEETATLRKFRIVRFYNLDTILSVGYRVNSMKATQFRIWVTQTRKRHFDSDLGEVPSLLKAGATKARETASHTLGEVKRVMGLG